MSMLKLRLSDDRAVREIFTDDVEIEVFREEEKLGSVRISGITDQTALIVLGRNGETKAVTWERKGL